MKNHILANLISQIYLSNYEKPHSYKPYFKQSFGLDILGKTFIKIYL